MNSGKCRGCGAPIVWVRTWKGNCMPCEAVPVNFTPDVDGKERFLVEGGQVVRGTTVPGEFLDEKNVGFRPHWQKCPAAGLFRPAGKRVKALREKAQPVVEAEPLPTWEQMLADEPAEQTAFD